MILLGIKGTVEVERIRKPYGSEKDGEVKEGLLTTLWLKSGKSITPNLEKFSQDSVVFQNAIAPSSWTVPPHISLFTCLYPRKHGVHEDLEGGSRHI